MLASLVTPAASQEESQGKPPVVVLAGDFNSQKAHVTEAIQTLIVPGLRHERLCFVGMDEMHLPRLKTDKPRDWLICSNYLERLIWKDAFVARDKQHVVVSAIMCPRSSSNPPPPPAHPAASQGGVSAKHPELAQAILQRMYQRQLARQRVEDDLARGEEMSESEEKKEDEPKTKRAKAWLLLYVCIN